MTNYQRVTYVDKSNKV